MSDLAPHIAEDLIESRRMPCGYFSAVAWALITYPTATGEQIARGYEIALEVWEDDYLFAQA